MRPPVIAATLLLAALVLSLSIDVPTFLAWPWRALGAVPIVLGVALAAAALGWFRRRDTTHDPFGQPEALVIEGPYRFTRNPMYVGVMLVLLGIALLVAQWPYLLVPLVFILSVRFGFVPREERRLAETFGHAYAQYRSRVRRWL
jgi:protein-S-isoprenylcysteine O-methyltransferase Ste14